MNRWLLSQALSALFCLAVLPTLRGAQESNYVAGALVQLNDNGAWSWFMDERAIVSDGKLIVGSVRSMGTFSNIQDPDWGNIEVAAYDLATGSAKRVVLQRHFEQDDHNSPGLLALPDNRLLAMYSKHGQDRKIYYRFSEPGNPLRSGEVHKVVAPGADGAPFKADNVTYNNLVRLEKGRIYIRFHYGRWDGTAWRTHEMAYAGRRLYAYEADYTGLAVLDRQHPGVVYISTDADPGSGRPLISAADGQRHHELFRGTTTDGGKTWRWEPLTRNSTMENLRPVVPDWRDSRSALVWMRGTYSHNRGEWTTAVVATILPPRAN
jgi:hypothetical protein